MGKEGQRVYYKEHILLVNRTQVLSAILEASPTKLQSYIGHMLAACQSAKSSPDKINKQRFVPGPPSAKLGETQTTAQLLQQIQEWDPKSLSDLKMLQKLLAQDKRNIMDIVTSAKGVCSDYHRLKTSKARLDSAMAAKKNTQAVENAKNQLGDKDVQQSPAKPSAEAAVPHGKKKSCHLTRAWFLTRCASWTGDF
jgi:hypothetical protein